MKRRDCPVKIALACVAAYIIGSLNFSILLSRLFFHEDVRSSGSGNAGATNMARSYGMVFGLAVLALDFVKTLLAIKLGICIALYWGGACAGIMCILGHCFPLFFGFKGGKGAVCGLAAVFSANVPAGAAVAAVFLAAALLSKKISLASVSACAAAAVLAAVMRFPAYNLVLVLFAAAFIVFRHKANIARLTAGTEPSFSARRK